MCDTGASPADSPGLTLEGMYMRRTLASAIMALALVGGLSTHTAMADGLRCGGALITKGDDLLRVLAKCGEPASREQYFIHRVVSGVHAYPSHKRQLRFSSGNTTISSYSSTPGHHGYSSHDNGYQHSTTVAIPIEVWTYNLGPRRFMRQLKFEAGEVKELKSLGYGF